MLLGRLIEAEVDSVKARTSRQHRTGQQNIKGAGRRVSSLCEPQQDRQHWPWKGQVIAWISSEPEGTGVFLQLENSASARSLYSFLSSSVFSMYLPLN